MAETGPITIAFAGAGDTTEANVEALLNDLLGFGEEGDDGFYADSPREEINIFFPASKTLSNKNLDKVVAWTAKANVPFYVAVDENDVEKPTRAMKTTLNDAEEIKEVSDITAELVDVLIGGSEDGEAYLVLLWGDDEEGPSDEVYDLLEAADNAGIQVKDLTAGLDDIKVTDEEAPANAPDPEPEPEPEPEKPARRGRGRRAAAAEEQKVEETPLEEPKKVTAAEARAAAKKAKEDGEAKKAEVLAETNARLRGKDLPSGIELTGKPQDLPHDRQTESSTLPGSVLVNRETLTVVADAVSWAAEYLAAVDTSNALVNLSDEVQPRPLTAVMIEATVLLGKLLSTPSEATGSTESDEQGEGAPDHQESLNDEAVARVAAEVAVAPRKSRGRPRADGTPAQPKDPDEPTITVFEDEDGNLTKAGRGRPPKGQKRTKITEAEAREAGLI